MCSSRIKWLFLGLIFCLTPQASAQEINLYIGQNCPPCDEFLRVDFKPLIHSGVIFHVQAAPEGSTYPYIESNGKVAVGLKNIRALIKELRPLNAPPLAPPVQQLRRIGTMDCPCGCAGKCSGNCCGNCNCGPKKQVIAVPRMPGRWTFPGSIEQHLQMEHGYATAGMTRNDMLDLHDYLHESGSVSHGHTNTNTMFPNLLPRRR